MDVTTFFHERFRDVFSEPMQKQRFREWQGSALKVCPQIQAYSKNLIQAMTFEVEFLRIFTEEALMRKLLQASAHTSLCTFLFS